MVKIKYDFRVTDIDALEAFAKNAVVVEKKAVRGMITKMLDAGVEVPGIEIVELSDEGESEEKKGDETHAHAVDRLDAAAQNEAREAEHESKPSAFHEKAKAKAEAQKVAK